jgi:hypothetical protein
MKLERWEVLFALALLFSSLLIYLLHYAIFGDIHHILIYLVADIAFLPIEVLLVTLILHRLLANMEKRSRMEKLNMVIGAFFVEVGTDLLTYLSDADPELDAIRSELVITAKWTDAEFARITKSLETYSYRIDISKVDLDYLKATLSGEREFFLRLIENPALMEHESFTDLLLAISHLSEELARRKNLEGLPKSDLAHLAVDIKRAYERLVREWLSYMRYLKIHYPYLFSLAMRTNPFDQAATPVIR